MDIGRWIFSAGLCLASVEAAAVAWDRPDVIAKASGPQDRCSTAVAGQDCTDANQFALDQEAITPAAHEWLQQNSWYVTVSGRGRPGSICRCECFAAESPIATDEAGASAEKRAADIQVGQSLLALNPDSGLSDPVLEAKPVAYTIAGEEAAELYVFSLTNQRALKVTGGHGMVLADGRMVKAADVSMNDWFVGTDGAQVGILGITREPAGDGKVYNFEVTGEAKEEHVIVAEGVLIGDLRWQNQYATELEAVRLRQ